MRLCPFEFERKYIFEEVGELIEKRWVVINSENQQIVGFFDAAGEEAVFLIHPNYRMALEQM